GDRKVQKILGIRQVAEPFYQLEEGTWTGTVDFGQGPGRYMLHAVPIESLRRHATKIRSPFTGKAGSLTEPRQFNLMFKTYVGAVQDEDSAAYLRPETAQGIFVNFHNVVDTSRVKVPFGIAQTGNAFRNEVT